MYFILNDLILTYLIIKLIYNLQMVNYKENKQIKAMRICRYMV